MNEKVFNAGSIMEILFSNLNVEDSSKAVNISNDWKKIVSNIKSSPDIDEKRNENLQQSALQSNQAKQRLRCWKRF